METYIYIYICYIYTHMSHIYIYIYIYLIKEAALSLRSCLEALARGPEWHGGLGLDVLVDHLQ